MTLRVRFEIVPFGDENGTYPIYQIDIHNRETVEDQGFGHVICSYDATVYKVNNETMQNLGMPEKDEEHVIVGLQHDRRDGALELVRKVLDEIYEDSP